MRSSDWEKVKLGELCQINKKTYSVSEKWGVVNYLDTGNLTEDQIQQFQYIETEKDKLPSRARRKVEYDDILYSTVRPNQHHYGIVKEIVPNMLVSTGFAVISVDKSKADSDFIYYYLTQNEIVETLHVIGEQSTSAYPSIKPSDITNLKLSLPSLEEQKEISRVLRLLDKKIENNKKINHHLEQMAISIFENMFPNSTSGEFTIGEYIIPKRGKNLLSKDAIDGKVPVVAGDLQPSTFHNTANTKSPVLTISASGANAGYINLWHTPVWSSDSSYIDSSMTDDVYFWYVLLKKRQQEIYDSQTGSAQPHIYPKHIEIMPTVELLEEDISYFTKQVTPLFETIGNNLEEINRLKNFRDALLPKLLSGEISVNQATK
ncbi:restriction endonuclease subunit S [Streptococcus constellatus]|uniref:restriction endonuclease subunit S n=1 Tax=Streptococcus constellatus TaxID=76860 RepID=UPI00080BB24F|nr:restriction endonuclease subunit S [Streptococcus constellatus]